MPTRLVLIFLFCVLLLASCERAQQFPAVEKPRTLAVEKRPEDLSRDISWTRAEDRPGLQILFVSDQSPEWNQLPGYWNPRLPKSLMMFQSPLQVIAAAAVWHETPAIKVKVPLGLPDPTPLIPRSNLPTFGKWLLGKILFHRAQLRAGDEKLSCASCHKSGLAFTNGESIRLGARYDTLSLVNVVYNRRQFWDGQVESLEETLVRSLNDERNLSDAESRGMALRQHVWGGFVRTLRESDDPQLNDQFRKVFGIPEPTQDAVAKALATYLRTLLSGDSLFDRARKLQNEKGAGISFDPYRELLRDDKAIEPLIDGITPKPSRDSVIAMVSQGYALFQGKAGCVQCHSGPLFTDHDYHNIGYPKREGALDEGQPGDGIETGRAVHVPIGLKQTRLVGAYRTPSLRNLSKTAPYFHSAAFWNLREVIEFYDERILPTVHLARQLHDGDPLQPRRLRLTPAEKDALVIFLRTLEGTGVDPFLTK